MTNSEAHPNATRIFFSLLRRDAHVARREIVQFLVRTLLQPLLFTVVFGLLLPKMGYLGADYIAALFPGIVALSMTFSSIQAVAFPLVADFGWTKEIEDRLLAPVPTWLIAIEKVVAGVIQGVLSGLVILPMARFIMGPIKGLTFGHSVELVAVTILGAAAFSALGLWIGTAIPPQAISVMFNVIFVPLIFFGCTYYPWKGLRVFPVLQYAVLVNPLVYVSEGMRGAMTPTIPHMHLGIVVVALVALTILFLKLGIGTFYKRAIG